VPKIFSFLGIKREIDEWRIKTSYKKTKKTKARFTRLDFKI
jgi:hypothetical protein